MIKLIYCLRRLPNLSPEEFQRYWREHHGPLVQSHAEALRIRRYVQSHTRYDLINETVRSRYGARPEPYDGVAELWWDTVEDRLATTPEQQRFRQEHGEDERRFIDHSRSPAWLAEEHVFVDR